MTEREQITDLYGLFEAIKKTPRRYLNRLSIFDLQSFYLGYSLARRLLKAPKGKQEIEFREFSGWLQKKFQIKAQRSWEMLILFHCYDERTAFDKFFELLEEFKNRGDRSEEDEDDEDDEDFDEEGE